VCSATLHDDKLKRAAIKSFAAAHLASYRALTENFAQATCEKEQTECVCGDRSQQPEADARAAISGPLNSLFRFFLPSDDESN